MDKNDTMEMETDQTEPRGTKRTASDAELPSNEQRRIRVRLLLYAFFSLQNINKVK